jgi:hypothetical protein
MILPMSDAEKEASFNMTPWILTAAMALAASVVWLLWSWRTSVAPNESGDWVGGHIGVGVGAAGTVLFFAALLMQREELQLQRKELRRAREIAALQEKHAEEQVQIARAESARRALGQLLEARIDLSTDWSPQMTGDLNAERERRLARLSYLVVYHVDNAPLQESEKDRWRTAFGPWVEYKLKNANKQVTTHWMMSRPFTHESLEMDDIAPDVPEL